MFRRPDDLRDEDFPIKHRATGSFAEIEPLLVLCAQGKLYQVEEWLAQGRPVQFPPPEDRKLQRRQTALQIAVGKGFHSLAALLLANGYNPNADYYECLSPAVRNKDRDIVDLLFRFGADPNVVDFCDVLETCDRPLMDRVIAAGADPCRGNAVARALHFKGRPILGFIKQYQGQFPGIQRQIDIALHSFTDAGDLRGIALMLLLGANPHAETPSSAYEDGGDPSLWNSAFERALWANKPEILPMFLKRPIPADKRQKLLELVSHRRLPALVQRLLNEGADPNSVGEDGDPVLPSAINCMLWRFEDTTAENVQRGIEAVEILLKAGAKWSPSERELKSLRRELAGGESRVVIPLVDLLKKYIVFTPEEMHELTRTPSVRNVLKGNSRIRSDPWAHLYSPPPPTAASVTEQPRRPFWRRHWSQH